MQNGSQSVRALSPLKPLELHQQSWHGKSQWVNKEYRIHRHWTIVAGAHTIIILGSSHSKVRTSLIYSSPYFMIKLSVTFHRTSLK